MIVGTSVQPALKAIGIDPTLHDIRFVEDDWEIAKFAKKLDDIVDSFASSPVDLDAYHELLDRLSDKIIADSGAEQGPYAGDIGGAVVIQTLHWFKAQPHYFAFISAWVASVA